MRNGQAIFAVLAFAVSLSLAGCGALLGGGKPEQLYRFGAMAPAAPGEAGSSLPAARYSILLMPVRFAAEIEGDRVLASRDRQALYVKGVRWVAPASTLFEQSVRATFRSRVPWIAVTDRRAGGQPGDTLQIRVDRFEARYDAGPKNTPTIYVEGEATLGDARTQRPVGSYRISVQQRAQGGDSRAMIAAFDAATANATVGTVDWASTTVAPR